VTTNTRRLSPNTPRIWKCELLRISSTYPQHDKKILIVKTRSDQWPPTIGPQPISSARPESSSAIDIGLNLTTHQTKCHRICSKEKSFNPGYSCGWRQIRSSLTFCSGYGDAWTCTGCKLRCHHETELTLHTSFTLFAPILHPRFNWYHTSGSLAGVGHWRIQFNSIAH
jgi:hypothetical protein